MAVHELTDRPQPLAHFPDTGDYRWLELRDPHGPYGHAAIAARPAYLELHLILARWGPATRRQTARDLHWFKAEAKRLGLPKIMGIWASEHGHFDPNLFRFARLFGFTEMQVFQTMGLPVE